MNASSKTWVPDASNKQGAYQLLTDGQVAGHLALVHSSEAGPVDPELDALLWYLLLPSVREDTDGSFLLTVA